MHSKLSKLISDHFEGDPWIDVTIMGTLKKMSAAQASKKVSDLNSIWQIVNHMIGWRETLLKRVSEGPIKTPDNNFIDEIKDTSQTEWNATLKRLQKSQKDILSYLSSEKTDLDEKFQSGYTRYELIEAILQHDAYHLGQIVLLSKLTGSN